MQVACMYPSDMICRLESYECMIQHISFISAHVQVQWPANIMAAFLKPMKEVFMVEMELSLMYDILYTKAAVIHTCVGYSIRVASLTTTAMVIVMFSLYT